MLLAQKSELRSDCELDRSNLQLLFEKQIKITLRVIFLSSWRRVGDSNSRTRSPQSNDLANRPLQPLG